MDSHNNGTELIDLVLNKKLGTVPKGQSKCSIAAKELIWVVMLAVNGCGEEIEVL